MKSIFIQIFSLISISYNTFATKCGPPTFAEKRFRINMIGTIIKEKNYYILIDDKKNKVRIIDPKNLIQKHTKGLKNFKISVSDSYSLREDVFDWYYETIYNPCRTQSLNIHLKDGQVIKLPADGDIKNKKPFYEVENLIEINYMKKNKSK